MKSKLLIILIALTIAPMVFSQQANVNVFQRNLAVDYRVRDFVVNKRLSGNDGGEKFKGSYYLFKDWNNKGKVQLSGKLYTFNNVNFNIQNNEFMSEIGQDSVFTVIPRYIDFIEINNKKYRYELFDGQNKFFEVLYSAKNKSSVLKGFHIRVIPKSEMGMLNRPYDELRKEEKLYISNGKEIGLYKPKKKELLKFIETSRQAEILKYMKAQKLSFKKEKDIIKLFEYYDTL